MATVTGFTAERMEAIEAASVVDGEVVGDNLILTRFDSSTIDAGNVRGPTGSPGITEVEFDEQLASGMEDAFLLNAPIGSILEYIEPTVPNALWLMMEGQTIVNGQTLYPLLWAKLPAVMKSGSSILMPNTKGKVSISRDPADPDFDTIGDTGGSKAPQLTTHLHTSPQHQHTQPTHSHTLSNHQHLAPLHTHGVNITTSTVGNHTHAGYGGWNFAMRVGAYSPGGSIALLDSNGDGIPDSGGTAGMALQVGPTQVADGGTHNHAVNGNSDSGGAQWGDVPNMNYTGNEGNQTVDYNVPSNTGSTGVTPTSVANVPPFIVFSKIIKAA